MHYVSLEKSLHYISDTTRNLATKHLSKEEILQELKCIELAKSDPRYFAPLYDRYYRSIFTFLYRRTGEEELTADLCSQTFLKAMNAIQTFRFQGVPFSAWLYRIALNELNMHFRKHPSARTVSVEEEGLHRLQEEAQCEEDLSEEQTLQAVLSELEPDEVQLIELRFFEEKSFKEVGEILNITENNAKVKTYRLLDRMKKILSMKGIRK